MGSPSTVYGPIICAAGRHWPVGLAALTVEGQTLTAPRVSQWHNAGGAGHRCLSRSGAACLCSMPCQCNADTALQRAYSSVGTTCHLQLGAHTIFHIETPLMTAKSLTSGMSKLAADCRTHSQQP